MKNKKEKIQKILLTIILVKEKDVILQPQTKREVLWKYWEEDVAGAKILITSEWKVNLEE